MKRVLIIDKCQDCNIENCKLRTMCGLIPEDCPLQKESEVNGKPSWDDAPDWANWLTYDESGWFWWEVKPIIDVNEYLPGDDVSEWGMAEQSNINTRSIYYRPESHKEVSK